jgi:multiple sugar transport system permease protein
MGASNRKILKATRKRQFWLYCILILLGLIILAPIFFLLLSSLKSFREFNAYPFVFFPAHPRWSNYFIILYPELRDTIIRTFGLGISTAAITCLTSAMAGYAFARIEAPGKKMLFMLVLALLILPSIVTQIPQFILYARLKLINTFWPWYLMALGANPLYIFMYRQFFMNFPQELEEAAEMDGATPAQIFISIILPNSKPIIATVIIFAFNAVWGDYLMPAIFLNDPSRLLGTWLAPGNRGSPQLLAATVIYIVPSMILFFLIQKNIQKGWLFTGLHG